MNTQIQLGNFTHGHCFKCGHMGSIGNFESKKINEAKSEGEDGMTMEFFQLILKCPMCGDEFCEAIFPNEVN